jgi:hypothetical protein
MGWVNVHWGMLQYQDVNLPHTTMLALDKVVEQIRTSLFLVQLIIESKPMMLSLEAPSDFTTNGWSIQVCEINEIDFIQPKISSNKNQVEQHDVHMT